MSSFSVWGNQNTLKLFILEKKIFFRQSTVVKEEIAWNFYPKFSFLNRNSNQLKNKSFLILIRLKNRPFCAFLSFLSTMSVS